MDYVSIGLVASFIALLVLWTTTKQKKNLPPGPKGWPLLGNIFVLFKGISDMHERFIEYGKEYGNIFYFHAGLSTTLDMIVLNDIDAVEEAYVKNQNDISGRDSSWATDIVTMSQTDVIAADYGQEFKNRKNILSKGLRLFVSGKGLENKVNNAVAITMKHIEEYANKKEAFDPTEILLLTILNVICGMAFSKQYSIEDEEFKELVRRNNSFANDFTFLIDEMLPRFIARRWNSKTGKKFIKLMDDTHEFIRRSIREHRERFDPECPPQDVVDYLLAIQEEKQITESGEELKKLNDTELLQIVHDLFFAGTDTSTTTMTWIILFLALHQDCQEKAFHEIKTVIGTEKEISQNDQHKLPYCKAFQMESLRLGMAAPIGVQHKAICDTKICGYDVPKGVKVIANHYALHRDPKHWENPDEFNPERFLEEDGTLKAKPRSWLPFSAGRRACLGENVARAEIFMIWVGFIQKFRITLPEGATPSTKQRVVPVKPAPYKIILEIRE